MVLEILADALEGEFNLNTNAPQFVGGPHPGQHQELRCVDDAPAENDFTGSISGPLGPPEPTRCRPHASPRKVCGWQAL